MTSQLDYRVDSLHSRLSDWRMAGYDGSGASDILSFGPGIHTLTNQIRLTAGQVLKGAGRDQTTLLFTKSLFQLFGQGPWTNGLSNVPGWTSGGGLIQAEHVSEVGIEDLTIAFPAHTQKKHHYEVGYNAIHFGNVLNGWVKRVRIINADSGLLNYKSTHLLFEDVQMDWPQVTKNAAGHVAHYGLMLGRDCTLCLIDRLDVTGLCRHDTDVANGAHHNVVMRSRFKNYVCSHHGGNPHHNLFTDIDCGLGTRVFTDSGGALSAMPHNGPGEVFWNLYKSDGTPLSQLPPFTGTRYYRKDLALVGHTLNRLNTDLTKEWVEGITPVEPANVYLAQRGEIVPPILPEEPPTPPTPALFPVGQAVEATASLVIRAGPAKSTTQLGTQPTGAKGTVLESEVLDPVSSFLYVKVNFTSGTDGYCGCDKLRKA